MTNKRGIMGRLKWGLVHINGHSGPSGISMVWDVQILQVSNLKTRACDDYGIFIRVYCVHSLWINIELLI
ncbi:hypothetical protein ACE6H2_016746 [Prunus campanulata]